MCNTRLALVLIGSLLAASATHAATSDTVEKRIQAVIHGLSPAVEIKGKPPVRSSLADEMKAMHVPGVAIAVIRGGHVDWAQGFGVTRKDSDAVTADTLFQAGSVSKPVAAMAALKLVQDGRLTLDTDINATLKTWKLPSSAYTAQTPVTLRTLLSHTASMTVHGYQGYAAGEAVPTLTQVLNGVAPANSKPVIVDGPVGKAYRYSGGGYVIAQQMMIDATSASFPTLVRDEVFKPIGMNRSTEDQPLDAARQAHAAWPHDSAGKPVSGGPHTYPEIAPAGLWTTANDLARFVIDLQQAAQGKEGHVLSPTMAKLMVAPVKDGYGLGVSVRGAASAPYFFHDGANAGYKATMLGYLKSGDGMVVLTNGDQGYELGQKIARAVAMAYGWPDLHPVERAAIDLPASDLAKYVGSYELQGVGDFEIRLLGKGLVAEIWKGVVDPLYVESTGRFFMTSHDLVLTFDGPDRGTIALDDFKGTFTRAAKP